MWQIEVDRNFGGRRRRKGREVGKKPLDSLLKGWKWQRKYENKWSRETHEIIWAQLQIQEMGKEYQV